MNSVILGGRIATEPRIKITRCDDEGAIIVCRFLLAVPRCFSLDPNREDTDFFCVTAFDERAEFISKHFTKGSQIYVTGNFRNYNYLDQNGTRHYTCFMLVQNAEFGEDVSCIEKTANEIKNRSDRNFEYMMQKGYSMLAEELDEIMEM